VIPKREIEIIIGTIGATMLAITVGTIISGNTGDAIIAIAIGAIAAFPMAYYGRYGHAELDKTIEDKLEELPKLCMNASSIKIATDLDPRFFGKKKAIEAFKKAAEDGAEIKFIIEVDKERLREEFKKLLNEKKIDLGFEEYEKLYEEGKIQIKFVKKLNKHLWVIDDATVRIEVPHEPLQFGKNGYGILLKDFPILGRAHGEEFDEAWAKA
jgi:hypothetical protein